MICQIYKTTWQTWVHSQCVTNIKHSQQSSILKLVKCWSTKIWPTFSKFANFGQWVTLTKIWLSKELRLDQHSRLRLWCILVTCRVPSYMLRRNSLIFPVFSRQIFPDFPWLRDSYSHTNEAVWNWCEPTLRPWKPPLICSFCERQWQGVRLDIGKSKVPSVARREKSDSGQINFDTKHENLCNVWPESKQNSLTFPDHSTEIKNNSLTWHKWHKFPDFPWLSRKINFSLTFPDFPWCWEPWSWFFCAGHTNIEKIATHGIRPEPKMTKSNTKILNFDVIIPKTPWHQ